MNFFYNNKGVGDVLIVTLKDRCKGERLVERKNAVARIYDGKNNKTVGFNFFDASKSLNLKNKKGSFTPEDSMIDDLNHLLENEGYKDRLSYSEQPAFVIADVNEKEKHPDADKLSVCQVDVGNDSLQIVCGAPNVEANQKVVVARVGAVMPSGMVIRDAKLRGVPSTGMICSAKELGLANPSDQKGILVLDTKESAGTDFFDTVNH